MGASIVLTGIDSSVFRPGTFLEVNFAKGVSAGFQGQYAALLIANMTSAGSATAGTKIYGPDTDVPCQTEDNVIALFGPGSEMHVGWLQFTKHNTTTPLYCLAVADASGTA